MVKEVGMRYGGVRAPIDFLLAYGQLVVGTACDLVQVGDGEYLMVLAQVSERNPDVVAHFTADAGIYLVKN